MKDDRGVHQIISLIGTEVFDCIEQDYLKFSIEEISRRHIFKKFNLNFFIKADHRNNTNYTVTLSTLI